MAKLSLKQIREIFRGRPASKEKKMDTTPIAMPAGYAVPTPLQDIIARMVRNAVEQEREEEFETLEESDDFDIDDDELLDLSPYELADLQDEFPMLTAERPVEPDQGDSPSSEGPPDPTPESETGETPSNVS